MGPLQIYNYYLKSGFEMVFSIRVDGFLDSTIILISTQMDFILILILTRYVIIFLFLTVQVFRILILICMEHSTIVYVH
jgi:hypothetical protein